MWQMMKTTEIAASDSYGSNFSVQRRITKCYTLISWQMDMTLIAASCRLQNGQLYRLDATVIIGKRLPAFCTHSLLGMNKTLHYSRWKLQKTCSTKFPWAKLGQFSKHHWNVCIQWQMCDFKWVTFSRSAIRRFAWTNHILGFLFVIQIPLCSNLGQVTCLSMSHASDLFTKEWQLACNKTDWHLA